ncbi:DUF7344 domain-containing protein [Halegenticoccus tardaugens]|uniref:DUF7344 domain-containing protein n=1 Tax=Halegenticoccus tardaugens TaxID=2071624 RepID=UPI001E54ECAD|nr:hypothetical protein [Halegenticoccus tardaugens]
MTEFETHRSGADIVCSTTTANVAFDLLSSRPRRCILYYLTHCAGAVELRELADQLVSWDETAIDDHERIMASLYHVHLPKLEENGVLTFDSTQCLIELDETADELNPYLELAAEDDLQTQVFDLEPERGGA